MLLATSWPVRGRSHCTVALAVGTSFSRVVKRGERNSNLVDQLRFYTKPARAGTTPCLLALFSIVTLLAAWYPKAQPTFSDALAGVRCALWRERALATSRRRTHRTKPRFALTPALGLRPLQRGMNGQSRA